jgi:rubrerythrin
MNTRRDFFRLTGLTAAGGSAAFLAACGGDDEKSKAPPLPTPTERDIRILNQALDLEFTAVAAYTAGAKLLKGDALAAGRQFLAQEQEHAAALKAAVKDLGGVPKKPRRDEEYAELFPTLGSQKDVLRFAVDLENMAVEAYLDAIPRLSSAELRQTGAAIVSNEAEHISVLLGALNPGQPLEQVPQAFVTGVASTS